jgi:hypothetical protein
MARLLAYYTDDYDLIRDDDAELQRRLDKFCDNLAGVMFAGGIEEVTRRRPDAFRADSRACPRAVDRASCVAVRRAFGHTCERSADAATLSAQRAGVDHAGRPLEGATLARTRRASGVGKRLLRVPDLARSGRPREDARIRTGAEPHAASPNSYRVSVHA